MPQEEVPGPPEGLEEAKKGLEKKASFLSSVKLLQSLVSACKDNAGTQPLYPAVARVFTLLKSRHNQPAHWRAGTQLFSTCLVSSCGSAAQPSPPLPDRACLR